VGWAREVGDARRFTGERVGSVARAGVDQLVWLAQLLGWSR
jgi:hypothetical protein